MGEEEGLQLANSKMPVADTEGESFGSGKVRRLGKMHDLKVESYVLFSALSEDLKPGTKISDDAEKTVPKR